MAIDYARVLIDLNVHFDVISRGKVKANAFKDKIGIDVMTGGLDRNLKTLNPHDYDFVINAVGQEELFNTTLSLIKIGFGTLLIEKPGGINTDEIRSLAKKSKSYGTIIFVAYNRRFYASVIEAGKIIKKDEGVKSFHFEFTELSHVMNKSIKPPIVKKNWFLCNSSHVVDMAFYLAERPKQINSYIAGGISWHPLSSIFVGSGRTENGALFSYQANWEAPGHWRLEIMTKKHRIIFDPLEKLKIQKFGSYSLENVNLNDKMDNIYKPGIYLQVLKILKGDTNDLCSIDEQVSNLKFYEMIMFGSNDRSALLNYD
jgi:predicted dehydrogenase